jgi:hypothetical protein
VSEVAGAGFADLHPPVPEEDGTDERTPSYADRLRISLRARATTVATEHQELHLELDRLRAKAADGHRG